MSPMSLALIWSCYQNNLEKAFSIYLSIRLGKMVEADTVKFD